MAGRQPFGSEKFEQPTIKPRGDGPHWVVLTKNPEFGDVLAMVPFVKGRAVVYDEALVVKLVTDFDCTSEPPIVIPGPRARSTDIDHLATMRPADPKLQPGADPDLLAEAGQLPTPREPEPATTAKPAVTKAAAKTPARAGAR